jgi:hypothetical protein
MGGFKVVFYNGFNDSTETKLVVCVDKDWGTPGCGILDTGSAVGDWVHDGLSTYNSRLETPYFYPVNKLTIAVTSPCSDYRVEVRDQNNNVLLTVTYDGTICGAFPFFVPTPTPTPTSTPTPTPSRTPSPSPTPSQTPTATPTPSMCSPLIKTGIEFLDMVLFCVGGVGVTVLILVIAFVVLLMMRR